MEKKREGVKVRQFPIFLVYFMAGVGVTALAFFAFFYEPSGSGGDILALELFEKIPAPEPSPPQTPPPSRAAAHEPRHSAEPPSPAPSAPKERTGPSSLQPRDGTGPVEPASSAGARAFPVVRGSVTWGADSSGMSGVPVRVLREGKWHAECLTDSQGNFVLGVPGSGSWRVAAFPFGDAGFQPGEDLTLGPGEDRFLALVVPARVTLQITGQAKGEDGAGIPGVKVEARSPGGDRSEIQPHAVTDSEGSYVLQGLKLSLEKPTAQMPREVRRDGGFSYGHSTGWRRRGVSVNFNHPDYGHKSEYVMFGRQVDGRIRLDVTLLRPGWIAGTLSVPQGGSVDGKYLKYRIVSGGGSHGAGVSIKGNRFRIPVKNRGRLVLGHKVGEFRVVEPDLGKVDRNTQKQGVVVRLERLQTHEIVLQSETGRPLTDGIRAYIEGERFFLSDIVSMRSGKVIISIPLKEAKVLVIMGKGVKEKRVRLLPGNLPATLGLQILAPLMTGVVRFPPDFDASCDVRLGVQAKTGSGSSSSSGRFRGLDEKTGAFTIHRNSDSGPETVYTVTVTIPGYLPWKKENIRLKEGKTLANVEVTFKK